MRGKFIYLDSISENSRLIDKSMKAMLAEMSPQERERFVESIYEAIQTKTGAKTLTELNSDKMKLFEVWNSLDEESKLQFRRFASLLVGKKAEKKKK